MSVKTLVGIKQVVDPGVPPRLKADGSGPDTASTKLVINPFDAIALEQAIRLRETSGAGEVIAVSIGPQSAAEVLRVALAMGADRAILVKAGVPVDPLAVARMLAEVVTAESVDLVILGKQAVDEDSNQTGQMLAGLLDWPQATFASELRLDGRTATVTRDVDEGREVLLIDLPCVVTADLRLAEPRNPSLLDVMKARRRPIEEVTPRAMGNVRERLRVLKVEASAPRAGGLKVASVDELIDRLRHQAGVIR